MTGRLANKSALITGGGRGIGKAIAQKFLLEGARIAVLDVVADRVSLTASELAPLGDVHPVVADLSLPEECQRGVEEADAALGGLDIVVNNAGIIRLKHFLKQTLSDWDLTIAVNARAPFLIGQAAARKMIEHGRGGVIINGSSTNGFVAERNSSTYDASKGAVVMLTQAMALDLAPLGIRVAGVAPGLAPTDLAAEGGADVGDAPLKSVHARVPIGRMATLEEIANVYAFVASDEAAHVAGTTVVVDGGLLSRQFGDSD
ncbi:SDR family NAD(P)-dependent oxidoreductase [Mycobacterium aquaticum]|uniref:Dehydrogenase n=1 Tax=Mycobacterium aquaticum TaxID=1927124 RepID=A0A1X0B4P1_9MYCO|nr:SDR family oxidoreductase [Mycobacterium aquaticum]ORA37179.1 hypothetical protein BST13_08460 [Mycobacterium aquaticum]